MSRVGSRPVIGLIGGIGAGKSAVARAFAVRGGRVVDADAIGHEALRQPEIIACILERWGARVRKPDGSLDRRAIAKIVFADPIERNALEAMVFPYIGDGCRKEIDRARREPGVQFVVLDAAVMLEAGWNNEVDRIVYVDAPPDVRYRRLAARSGWSRADLAAREAAQLPGETKRVRASAVITNDAGLAELQEKVDRLLCEWGMIPANASPATEKPQ